MKKISFSIIAFCLMLCVGTNPLFSQDEEAVSQDEEAAASDTTAVEDLEDEIDEAFLEEEEAEEEYDAASPFEGFTVGLNVGMPVVGGEYYAESGMDPCFGVVIGTPYGLPLGPFSLGVNAGIESANGLTGAFAILNLGIDAISEKVGFPVTVFGGVGMLEGMGIIGGASLDYPMDPVVIKPYLRATISTAAASDNPTGWIQIGAMVSYSL
ncbi:MAG: hypothetical protein QF859_05480 [Candidatus Marinimicrobia bacterium]|jgi:hypothetical protein|nr:hypothetical protein [Candidatus Neomarinimicrobiota bacterium]MDP7128063.1 hypothetical protein [Candidatus Neomarinimicrobiota bacterium]MDP7475397.1 hypothetical protein [Candidatus Neomarinimicrobiota bacterium]MEE1507071.1 hypothetical protein [Candidatus Neomarinimicrobiota bacterium]